MIVIDCTVDDRDLTMEQLAEQFEVIKKMAYPNFQHFPIVSIKCLPDEIWITEWQQKHIFNSIMGDIKLFRGIPLKVIFTI